jgi:hypothetical protein
LIRFTDGSKADSGTGSGIFGVRPNGSLRFPLDKYTMVFQTEIYVYAILQCAYENVRRAYKNKWILIFSDSQAALKALNSLKVTSELVVECLNALSALAGLNDVTLVWVTGHRGISGKADKLARQVSAMPLTGPELALGIPKCSTKEAIRTWSVNQHYSAWRDLPGHRHGKLSLGRPCKKIAEDLLKLSRHQLKMVVAILTGHETVRKHLQTISLF